MTTTTVACGAETPAELFADTSWPAHLPDLHLKAALDRIGAALMLAVLGVPLLLLALAIRLSSRGPAFYRQTRLGQHGREFRMWKLRTMVVDADRMTPPGNDADGLLFKLREDPRVTAFGRFLRKWSLDELPQLVNVLRGDMSLVGPRPLPLALHQLDPVSRRRLLVRPGLTGLWQIAGRSDLSWDDCVRLDLHYVEHRSLRLDLAILGRTALAVIRRAGAY